MKHFLRNIFNRLYNSLNKQQDPLLVNVFKRKYDKRVLISYITLPFISGINDRHTNSLECYTACELFDELGYSVDVIDYNNYSNSLNYEFYDVIYGFGESFEKLFYWDKFYEKGSRIKKIVYATGCDTVFSNKMSLYRINEFYKKTNIFCINSGRIVANTWRSQIIFSDLIIALGNEYVADTYREYNRENVKSIDIFFKNIGEIDIICKNFEKAKLNFIWWGSAGAIHKGLDIIVEVFSRYPHICLYICGFLNEYPFSVYLANKIEKHDNIKDLGFVQVGSEQHLNLLRDSIATILPSASEGGAAGIVNACSTAGLIPIITKSCGIDVPECADNFVIDELTEDALESSIIKVVQMNNLKLLEISVEIQKYFRYKHAYDTYRYNLKKMLYRVIA